MHRASFSIQTRKLLFIKHAYSHLYASNDDHFKLFYIHLLMHIQVRLYRLQKRPRNALYGQPHSFESPRTCGQMLQTRKIKRNMTKVSFYVFSCIVTGAIAFNLYLTRRLAKTGSSTNNMVADIKYTYNNLKCKTKNKLQNYKISKKLSKHSKHLQPDVSAAKSFRITSNVSSETSS